MKIGVFGGSFNPVHNGHIAVARAAVRAGLVDKVLLVLSPLNPLKAKPEELLEDKVRLEMLRLACQPYPELEACDIELTMPRPSYTVDTLRKLSELHPSDSFRLIIGADNYEIFSKWRSYQEIIERFQPIVYPREGYPMPPSPQRLSETPLPSGQSLHQRLSESPLPSEQSLPQGLSKTPLPREQSFHQRLSETPLPSGQSLHQRLSDWSASSNSEKCCLEGFTPLDAPLFPFSSTEIRNRIRRGEPIDNLVPSSVLDYIDSRNLYRSAGV